MTRSIARTAFPLATWLVLAAAGCSLLRPQPEVFRFYLLTPIEAGEPARPRRPMVLGIGPVHLPEYLDRPEVVVRTGPNEIKLSASDRWAEPLKSGFRRVFADNLSRLIRTERVVQFPWYRDVGVDYQVYASVQRFDATTAGQATLVVRWGIKSGSGKEVLSIRETRYESAGKSSDPGADAGALSETLAAFSRDVAVALGRAIGSR
jgi:uncharacterized lipoprotein YmbA